MEENVNRPITSEDQEKYWQAILARDSRFEGEFVYGVRSTGIYCRPGCSSRLPGKAQVVFFSTIKEAEKAGFRPCKRCQPQNSLAPAARVDIVERACRLMDNPEGAALSLADLSRKLAVSPSYLQRIFRSTTGLTPYQYRLERKLKQFKTLVREGEELSGALYDAGFGSSSRLYEKAISHLGMTPGSYRRGGEGMEIHYTFVDTFIGRMLVAATQQGICAVSFGDDEAVLETFLREEYPQAVLKRDHQAFNAWIEALAGHLEGLRPDLDLPLDVQATAFTLRVWQELRRIPYGETRTYAEIAQAVGRPKAVRAVANACASNPAAVVTPCHRVLRSDGSLGGYRWGTERKQALLDREKEHAKQA
jgi:AraC family transcriptional regulator of adaptative response/methylated-DNA-[protein]-cysteine methyltransferase